MAGEKIGVSKTDWVLGQILELVKHNHVLLHLVLKNQDVEQADIDKLLAASNNQAEWMALVAKLKKPTDALNAALKANQFSPILERKTLMASTIPQSAIDQIAATEGVEDSAILALGMIPQKIQDAVNAAIADGATAAQLAPVQTAVDDLKAKTAALAAAIAANP